MNEKLLRTGVQWLLLVMTFEIEGGKKNYAESEVPILGRLLKKTATDAWG